MTKRIVTQLEDDLDGTPAIGTFLFAVGEVGYEIELSEKNHDKLMTFLEPYIGGGRRTTGKVRYGDPAPSGVRAVAARSTVAPAVATTRPAHSAWPEQSPLGATALRQQNQRIREWAKQNDFVVADRGAIPEHVKEKYWAAMGGTATPEDSQDDGVDDALPVPVPMLPPPGKNGKNGKSANGRGIVATFMPPT